MSYFLSIFLGTFVLEDVALASALALSAQNKVSYFGAFLACFFGIAVGDLGLYGLGLAAEHFRFEDRFARFRKLRNQVARAGKTELFTYSIIFSRFVPGTRLPTYVSAGLLGYPFLKFLYLTLFSVFFWVLMAFFGGASLHKLFMDHWWIGLLAFFAFLQVLKFLIPKISDPWKRKSLLHSWRIWTHFEFWPAWFFYIPLVPIYIFLSAKHRSFLIPLYANPSVKHGGMIGESKWDFLKHLKPSDFYVLKTLPLEKNNDFLAVKKTLEQNGFAYPFILKPDVGQRGFGVRVIGDDFDLTQYLLLAEFKLIAQRLSLLKNEAGIFYVRKPDQDKGHVFSITDKKFPTVSGDGKTKLGDLILKDPRARIIASVYFSRHRDLLDSVPAPGQVVFLSECGNHCQGAVFLNSNHLRTPELEDRFDQIAKKLPHFYFGRFDIRYQDEGKLMSGTHFEIVEINGAGSEATHIWDAKTTLGEAYQTLWIQWQTLFEIGAAVKRAAPENQSVELWSFLKECGRVYFRKDSLSVSS